MKFLKKSLRFEDAVRREWIVTNGIGGFCSTSALGINTRRYHGILVAPLNPPAKRHLIVSKVDEKIDYMGKEYPLYSNMCPNFISEGYKRLVSFEKDITPEYHYKVQDIDIFKKISMKHGKNITAILYTIKGGKTNAKLRLTPLLNFRDFHSLSTCNRFNVEQKVEHRFVSLKINNSDKNIYLNCSHGKYVESALDSFKNMYYIEEEKRGLDCIENHAIAGFYEVDIEPNTTTQISFLCSFDDTSIRLLNARDVIEEEENRVMDLIESSELKGDEELIKKYVVAVDNFIVSRKRLSTLIAGYPWFLDWGRDTLISFEGTVLKTKQFDVARKILRMMVKELKYGLIPNGFSEQDDEPLYNSVDSSLLFFEEVKKFLNYTGDFEFVEKFLFKKMQAIIKSYSNGIDFWDNNIKLESDGLISSGRANTQNTWMDVKIGDYAVTPRNGKAVEINAMWYNALKIMEELATKFCVDSLADSCRKHAERCKSSFIKQFYNKENKCLDDVVGDSKIRPNQLWSLALSYPVMDPGSSQSLDVIKTVTKKLVNKYGLKTLSKESKYYTEVYEGDQYRRDLSYHQGITWPWLLGIYNDALKKVAHANKGTEVGNELAEQYKKFVENLRKTFLKEIEQGKTIGSISELYDSRSPYEAKGAFAQCWSVAEVFRIIV